MIVWRRLGYRNEFSAASAKSSDSNEGDQHQNQEVKQLVPLAMATGESRREERHATRGQLNLGIERSRRQQKHICFRNNNGLRGGRSRITVPVLDEAPRFAHLLSNVVVTRVSTSLREMAMGRISRSRSYGIKMISPTSYWISSHEIWRRYNRVRIGRLMVQKLLPAGRQVLDFVQQHSLKKSKLKSVQYLRYTSRCIT